MKCPNCGSAHFHEGLACWSCGKGEAVRTPTEKEQTRVKGGWGARRFKLLKDT